MIAFLFMVGVMLMPGVAMLIAKAIRQVLVDRRDRRRALEDLRAAEASPPNSVDALLAERAEAVDVIMRARARAAGADETAPVVLPLPPER